MVRLNISLPDSLKTFIDKAVGERGYGTRSGYVRELLLREQQRQQLRDLLLAGVRSTSSVPAGAMYFDSLRAQVGRAVRPRAKA